MIVETMQQMQDLPDPQKSEAREAMERIRDTASNRGHGMATKVIDRGGRLWLAYLVDGWWYVPASRKGATFTQDGFRVQA